MNVYFAENSNLFATHSDVQFAAVREHQERQLRISVPAMNVH